MFDAVVDDEDDEDECFKFLSKNDASKLIEILSANRFNGRENRKSNSV
jgi:hypothetical protein